ncbi:MAG: histidine phosphatase family protein [Gemmatimonadota bacterium]|nr:histidine phosphatase family protein [Gemmatimonadales bacterium]MDQ3209269.1 histidine phosphatase family protein [Gemmatimonadota bacterium]
MKLLIIRHGPAGDSAAWEAKGRDDRVRPLTAEGKKQMRKAAAGLAVLAPDLPVLATSSLTRAFQTAEIVAAEYECEIVPLEALEPDHGPEDAVGWLRKQQFDTMGLVGHEPHLSTLVGYLITGKPASFLDLKKGGACLLEMTEPLEPGGGALEWLLTPRALRRLGE